MDRRRLSSTLPSSSNSPVAVPNPPPPPSEDYAISDLGWEIEPDVFGKYDDSEGCDYSEDSDDGEEESDSDDGEKESEVVAAELRRKALVDVTIDPLVLYVVCIDGYYRKDGGGPGGYGAILRCDDGQPIAAISGASDHGVSEFYHTLEGIRAGFRLAIQNNVKYMKIVCNADWVYLIVGQCFSSNLEGRCRAHPQGSPSHDFDEFCVSCFKMTKASADFARNFEIMKEIVRLGKEVSFHGSYLSTVGRDWNEPADFLAKMELKSGEELMLKPHEFPDRLFSLLSKYDGNLPYELDFI